MTGHDDFLALNILSPHAGAATFACVFISHFVEAKSKTNTADLCVYYSLQYQVHTGNIWPKKLEFKPQVLLVICAQFKIYI